MAAEEKPFRVSTSRIRCPLCEDWLEVQLGWVIPEAPVLHFSCPEVIAHLHEKHGRS